MTEVNCKLDACAFNKDGRCNVDQIDLTTMEMPDDLYLRSKLNHDGTKSSSVGTIYLVCKSAEIEE